MLVLGYAESLLPSFGIPGIKPGLSNSVLIFAVYMLGIPTAYIMMTLKVLLSGLLFGGMTAMIYAFAGGLASLTVMCLVSRIRKVPPAAVSMAGGVCHNAAQVGIAMLILHTPAQMLYYLAVLMAVGLGCGFLTGVIAASVMKHVKNGKFGFDRTVQDERRGVRIVIAVLTVAAAGALCLYVLKKNTPVVTLSPDTDTEQTVQMILPEDLPGTLHVR